MIGAAAALIFLALVALVVPRPHIATPYPITDARLAADDGPTPDDEPAVEEEDDNGDDADGDSADVPEADDAPPTTAHSTHATTTTSPSTPVSAAGVAAPPRGKALGDGTFLAPFTDRNGVKVFQLTMMPLSWEVEPGKVFEAYTFNGLVPGPVIRVNEGDRVRVVVKNTLPISTGVHWHGMILPNAQDGIPGLTQRSIDPGQTYTYEWTAVATGTHWYHSHSSGSDIGRGLYGALEVVPKSGDFKADRDYRLIVGDTNLGFVLNGKSYPYTTPLAARVGEKVRFRLIGAGDQSHPMHLHGMPFTLVAQDGIPIEHPMKMDTLLISAGQTFDIIAEPTIEGRWLLHCHIFAHTHKPEMDPSHSMTGPVGQIAAGMTGITTSLDVSPATARVQGATLEAADPEPEVAAALVPPAAQTARDLTTKSTSSSSPAGSMLIVGVLLLGAVALLFVTRERRS